MQTLKFSTSATSLSHSLSPLRAATGGRFSRTLAGGAGNGFATPFEALRHCWKSSSAKRSLPRFGEQVRFCEEKRGEALGSAEIFRAHVCWLNVEFRLETPSESPLIHFALFFEWDFRPVNACQRPLPSSLEAAFRLQANLIRIRFLLKSGFHGRLFTLFLASVLIGCGSVQMRSHYWPVRAAGPSSRVIMQCVLHCEEWRHGQSKTHWFVWSRSHWDLSVQMWCETTSWRMFLLVLQKLDFVRFVTAQTPKESFQFNLDGLQIGFSLAVWTGLKSLQCSYWITPLRVAWWMFHDWFQVQSGHWSWRRSYTGSRPRPLWSRADRSNQPHSRFSEQEASLLCWVQRRAENAASIQVC